MNPPRLYQSIGPAVAGLVVALALSGCASSNSSQSIGNAASAESAIVDLKRGMTLTEIEALLGKPDEERAAEPASANIVIWAYHRRIGSRIDGVAPTMTSEPWVDPITGELKYLEKPEISLQRLDFVEELHLYFANGRLANAIRTIRREAKFTR